MSKTRPSPRRGGRRSKATPPIPSSEDTPPAPPKQKPKVTPKATRNVTPPSKKAIKPGQVKGKRNSNESKGKSSKGKKQSNAMEREECNNETEEPMEVIPALPGTNNPSEGEREDMKEEEEILEEEEGEKQSRRMDNEPANQSIGEELMECLSKSGGKKKKAMRNCSSCGIQSPVSRAKKCPNCGKNLFSKSSGYTQEINCPKCDYQQRYNGTLATAFCSRCNALITRKYKESSPDDTNESTHDMSEVADKLTDIEENAMIEYESDSLRQQNSLPCPVNSDGSFQLGYSYTTVEDKNSNETVGVVATPTDNNESSQETIRRIIKRKILDNIESSDTPDSKRPCNETEDQPVEANDPSGKVSLSLNIPVNMSLTPPTTSASSPLVEYAQKISARLLIPPEIPPQEASRRGRTRPPNARAGKSHLSKSKRAHKDSAHPVSSDPPPSPGSPRPPDQLEPSLIEGPPPLLHANEEPVCDQSMVLSPPPLISKTFHDPTSIRHNNNNSVSTFYSTPSSKAPLPPSTGGYCSPLDAAHANGQVVSKNLYPDQHRTSSVPPLLSIDEVEGGVARPMVIVDPSTTKVKDSLAPPTLLHGNMKQESEYVNEIYREEGQYNAQVRSDWSMDCTVKAKHSKRKQQLHLNEPITREEDEGIIYETVKKKKKKKKKEKDKERSDKSHKIKGEKHKSDSDKKVKKKLRKGKKKVDEMTSDNTMEDMSSQCTIETIDTYEESVLYSVKIKDCIIHQIVWGQFNMCLIVPQKEEKDIPLASSQKREVTPMETTATDSDSKKRRLRSSQKKNRDTDPMPEESDESPVKGRKRQECGDTEDDGGTIGTEESKSSGHIDYETDLPSSLPPSFSIFELRKKIFSGYPSRTVHAFTYKMKIRSFRPALYWVHILKRIGGLPDACHMCKLLDVESLKELCVLHDIEVPGCIDNLLGPHPDMTGRKLIDLSDEDPASFLLYPEILHHSLPHMSFQAAPQSSDQQLNSHPPAALMKDYKKKRQHEQQQDGYQLEEETLEEKPHKHKKKKNSGTKKLNPSLSKSNSPSPSLDQSSPNKACIGKKKPCPNCGYNMLRKSKKCVNCGKPFGVFTFGRRQCTYCDHINLARMSACFKCGQSLDKAPTAIPKVSESFDGSELQQQDPSPIITHDFKFGVKRKRRVHSLPSPPVSASSSHGKQHQQQQLQIHEIQEATYDSTDEVFNYECDPPTLNDVPEKRKRGEGNHLVGYRYGKIPWNDADLALIITSASTPKLCLQEVCSKVLRFHQKIDVFELVKSLNLQLEPGDSSLLKKLQALGLHPNRSPMCRLIASEDLFALMDALEEPVPDEVHQYLGNGGSFGAIEVSDGILFSHDSSPSSIPPNSVPPPNVFVNKPIAYTVGDDQEHGFESTLHEMTCSDGHLLSMLRTWEGDHFLCLLEVWRRYFPEVNRSNLSATIKRLIIETKTPTSQQTNLLRAAGIISVRGAPGRLIRVTDMQRLLDDLGIVLNIGELNGTGSKEASGVSQYPMHRNIRSRVSRKQPVHKARPHLNTEGNQLASCMSLLLDCVEPSEMETILTNAQEKCLKQIEEIDSSVQGQAMTENILHNHILSRRELCTVLSDEISFLTVTNHTTMTELVHMSYSMQQLLSEIDNLIDPSKIVLAQKS